MDLCQKNNYGYYNGYFEWDLTGEALPQCCPQMDTIGLYSLSGKTSRNILWSSKNGR